MNKLLMWIGVVLAIWSLTISGHKSMFYVLGVLAYIAIVCFITFGGGAAKKLDLDRDYSASK